jgi:hypothetical protein
MELDQEELVKLIFGDEEPENWKDNPDFLLYLSELGNIGERQWLPTLGRICGHVRRKKFREKPVFADPGCLSRILIFIHPGSRIPNLTTAPKGGKILFGLPFFVSTNIIKL